MNDDTGIDLVTGAFSYAGAHLAERLLATGRNVRTLTFHPDRPHSLQGRVEAAAYRFDDPAALARSLEGVSTLYNSYWVRFDHGQTTYANAIENSRALFFAAKRAGITRVVHTSIANPSLESILPYYRGKALVERALAEVGVPYSIVRPTVLFGGERDVLVNNIAWLLRRVPIFAVPGDGTYPIQPVHVEDLARICEASSHADGDVIVDAAGPETLSFKQLVQAVRNAVGARAPIVRLRAPILHLPPMIMAQASAALGLLVRDVVLTPDEIKGLMGGLLVSHDAPLGATAFSEWLAESGDSLGRSYANELHRHFGITSAATPF
ncbi:MAG: SDR family oxidoreductase [Solirubrobacteraceae bacterium]